MRHWILQHGLWVVNLSALQGRDIFHHGFCRFFQRLPGLPKRDIFCIEWRKLFTDLHFVCDGFLQPGICCLLMCFMPEGHIFHGFIRKFVLDVPGVPRRDVLFGPWVKFPRHMQCMPSGLVYSECRVYSMPVLSGWQVFNNRECKHSVSMPNVPKWISLNVHWRKLCIDVRGMYNRRIWPGCHTVVLR